MNASNDDLFQIIGAQEGFKIMDATSLSGGSINEVYLLNTSAGKKVIKLNDAGKFQGMFEAEKTGLQLLKISSSIDVPEVFSCGEIRGKAFLLLEHKAAGRPQEKFWQIFAEGLAQLHRNTSDKFGFSTSNYIGSLPQYNENSASAAHFYISQRLEPQIQMASKKGFLFKNLDRIFKNISQEIPAEPPALIHGDLWSGNYLSNENGFPCLIDPAVSFAAREMDLAMMQLFGGFSEKVFNVYSEIFPLAPHFKRRIPLWQLYYLLVHLNIFGKSYLPSVNDIFKSFS